MRLLVACSIVFLSVAAHGVSAQEDVGDDSPGAASSNGSGRQVIPMFEAPSMSSELWLYVQEQTRLEDPKYLVHRKAALKAEQRDQRLASSKWYGYSNSRPVASGMPFMGTYSPTWVGNGWNSFHWVGSTRPSITAVIVDHSHARR